MLTQYDGIGYMLDLQAMSVSKSPKIAKTPENIVFYSYYSNKGWNLKIDSFDRILTGEQKENTKYLTKMMRDAIDGEDYETAAILRDKIAKIFRR
jgi:excinuclease UvrABC helicase subunit UvrB